MRTLPTARRMRERGEPLTGSFSTSACRSWTETKSILLSPLSKLSCLFFFSIFPLPPPPPQTRDNFILRLSVLSKDRFKCQSACLPVQGFYYSLLLYSIVWGGLLRGSALFLSTFFLLLHFTLLFFLLFTFSPMGNTGCFLGESLLRQSCTTQPTVHAGCFSVFIIHRTLTWTKGSLTRAQMLMHAICTQGVYRHT